MNKFYVFFCIFFINSISSSSQSFRDMWQDMAFGINGLSVFDYAGGTDEGTELTILDDGSIIVVGSTNSPNQQMCILKMLPNGNLDSTFANNGVFTDTVGTTISYFAKVQILNSGSIIAVGGNGFYQQNAKPLVAKFLSNGILDTSFGDGGKRIYNIPATSSFTKGVQMLADGSIIVAGSLYQPNGASGRDLYQMKIDSLGNPDLTYGINGFQIIDVDETENLWAYEKLDNGKFLAGGSSQNSINGTDNFSLYRFNADGTLDSTFGVNGHSGHNILNSSSINITNLNITSDNEIYVSGWNFIQSSISAAAILKYDSFGILDNTFGQGGIQLITPYQNLSLAYDVKYLKDCNKLILGGFSDDDQGNRRMFFARFDLNTNSLDTSFDADGILIYDIGMEEGMALDMHLQNDTTMFITGRYRESGDYDMFAMKVNPSYPDSCTFVNNLKDLNENSVSIYPNPVTKLLFFDYHSSVFQNPGLQIHIHDVFGRKLKSLKAVEVEGRLDISDLASGHYIVSFELENRVVRKKLIKH